MDDLLADFIAETREMLEASQSEIIDWEADPSDRSRLDAIFRFVHTVKGNCGFFDFPRLERLSHAAEDALADVRADRREPNAQLVSAVLAIMDRIGEMTDAIESGEEFPEGGDDALIRALASSDEETGIVESKPAGIEDLTAGQDNSKGQKRNQSASANARTIRLPTELLDRVMSGVSDMVLARNDLAHRLRQSGNQPTIDGPFERLTTILGDVREAITRMRMQRIEHLFGIFPRLVRDLSNELGKQVLIDLEGGDVELDREMVEMIRDPLTHIVRNALDHGIEKPAERLKAGKREIGLLTIAARQSGNKISIVITDDGRGLDAEKIGAKAIENGLVTQSALDAMSREDILQLVFEPGLSTAKEVSSLSGRGVGLDVVRDNIEKVGGAIKVTSTPGLGSLFYLNIPLTLSIISGVTVGVGSQTFAIPQSYIEEIVQLEVDTLDYTLMGERGLVTFRGQRVPCLALSDLLMVESDMELEAQTAVMIRLANGDLIAMIVDQVHNIGDLVVKPLPPVITKSEYYGGATQLDDGTPILVLDVPQIALNAGLISDTRNQGRSSQLDSVAPSETGIYVMLFKGLDSRQYAMRMGVIQRIETIESAAIDRSGSHDRIVVNDRVLPLIGLDAGYQLGENLRVLRIGDGTSELAYAISRVDDAVMIEDDLAPANGEEEIEGLAIIEGSPVAVIDSFALFARHAQSAPNISGLRCKIPDSDWARTILAPLVSKCGYAIISEDSKEPVDLAIQMDDSEIEIEAARRVITLHEQETAKSDNADRIYRYDQDALVAALTEAKAKLAPSKSGESEEAA